MGSTMNSTFTSGFDSTFKSSEGMSSTFTSSFYNYGYADRSDKSEPFNRYAKYKLKNTIPVYTFHGNDSPLLGNSSFKSKIHGNEEAYAKLYDSARPVAHTNSRKYCSMTRFIKNLQDNRIFNKGKMSVYRGFIK